jgi:hypothetical protein
MTGLPKRAHGWQYAFRDANARIAREWARAGGAQGEVRLWCPPAHSAPLVRVEVALDPQRGLALAGYSADGQEVDYLLGPLDAAERAAIDELVQAAGPPLAGEGTGATTAVPPLTATVPSLLSPPRFSRHRVRGPNLLDGYGCGNAWRGSHSGLRGPAAAGTR